MTTPHTHPELEERQQLTLEAINNLAEQMVVRFDALEQNIATLSEGQQRPREPRRRYRPSSRRAAAQR